ncbi:MAG: D-alanyl-D-alanine carboxypeptidase family protein [Oscillospiraceae bacterium]|nr:D-alanyl-D-alanine carboxypeptidase family protein [Oscillospiraceae bacterium]
MKRAGILLLTLTLSFALLLQPVFAESAAAPETTGTTAAGETTESVTETAAEQEALYNKDTGFSAVDGFSVAGTSAMLLDLNSGVILYSQNPDQKVYPASLTKIMTCLIAIENGNLTDTVTVTATALAGLDSDGTVAELKVGEQMTLKDMLYCAYVPSANEACNVIAEHIGGSVENFVAMMNEKAAELGCTGTHFANAHGLHDENHYSTARDLIKIATAALQNDTFRELCYTTKYEVPATNMSEARTLYTTNYLVSTDKSYKYYYEKAKGVKTGYTSAAGRCLISTAESGNLHLLSIVTGCATTEDEDGEYTLHSFPETKSLFEYGFNNFEYVTVLSPMVPIAEVPVNGGESSSVVVAPVSEASFVLPKGYETADVTTTLTLTDGSYVQAPLSAGDVIGSVSVFYKGELLGSSDIAPITAVAAGSSTFHAEADTSVAQETGKSVSWPLVLLVLAALLLGVYFFSYVYRNVTRSRKKRRKR